MGSSRLRRSTDGERVLCTHWRLGGFWANMEAVNNRNTSAPSPEIEFGLASHAAMALSH